MSEKKIISKNTTVEHKCLICVCLINEYRLKCSRCYRSTCMSCLKLILDKIYKKDYDQWCHVVNTYINDIRSRCIDSSNKVIMNVLTNIFMVTVCLIVSD